MVSLHLGTRSGQTLAMRLISAFALGLVVVYGLKGTWVPRSKFSCDLRVMAAGFMLDWH